MRALTYTRYGSLDQLQFKDIPKAEPAEHEVLIRIAATSVNFNVGFSIKGNSLAVRMFTGLFTPKFPCPGNDYAGVVEAVGSQITRFKPGDEVYGDLARDGFGTYQEYVCVPEHAVFLKPKGISFEEAAAVPEAGLVALQALQDHGKIKENDQVLICGASGGIGSFAVQLAKVFGANVTAVCSTRNIELVKTLGADRVIDYTVQDFLQESLSQHRKYDLIIATAGYRPLKDYLSLLTSEGRYIATGGEMRQTMESIFLGPWLTLFSKKSAQPLILKVNKDLELLGELLESGRIKPVIDRIYPFKETKKALEYYETGKTRGKTVISFA